jgi:hypothetical protein
MTTPFFPHALCLANNPAMIFLHALSDAVICLCYLVIPLMMWGLMRFLPRLPFAKVWVGFCHFIVTCGLTHLLSIVVLWQPVYWLELAVKVWCACASALSVWMLTKSLPEMAAVITRTQAVATLERILPKRGQTP